MTFLKLATAVPAMSVWSELQFGRLLINEYEFFLIFSSVGYHQTRKSGFPDQDRGWFRGMDGSLRIYIQY